MLYQPGDELEPSDWPCKGKVRGKKLARDLMCHRWQDSEHGVSGNLLVSSGRKPSTFPTSTAPSLVMLKRGSMHRSFAFLGSFYAGLSWASNEATRDFLRSREGKPYEQARDLESNMISCGCHPVERNAPTTPQSMTAVRMACLRNPEAPQDAARQDCWAFAAP